MFLKQNENIATKEAKRRFKLQRKEVGNVKLTQNNIRIASTIKYKCHHWHKWEIEREKVNWEGEKQNLCTNTDYALNVQLMMTMQEIGWSGIGTNIAIPFLKLTHSSTMKTTIFQKIENKLGFLIRKNIAKVNAWSIERRSTS